jgi:thiol-disulfide isomerase/thioredoxin
LNTPVKSSLIFVLIVAIAGAAGYSVQTWLHREKTAPALLSLPSPEFAMRDLTGKIRNITEWKGKVVLLNFWATWCAPCIKEIPELIKLQKTYGAQGLQVVGVAVDDDQPVRKFAAKEGFNYPVLPGGTEAVEMSRRYGNKLGVLPFSAFIDRKGNIRLIEQGALKKGTAKKTLALLGISQ